MKKECLCCGGEKIVPIFWGYPGDVDHVLKLVEKERLVLGGCCVSDNDPAFGCLDCGLWFGNRRTQ